MPAFLRLDVFPAVVATPTGFLDPARVIITDERIYIYMDSPSGPEAVLDVVLYDFEGNNVIGWRVTDEDGHVYTVKRSTGCGCGSRLRGFRPFPGVPIEMRNR